PIRLGLAYALQPSWGADAIWWSFPAGSAASMAMTIAYYRYGGWRKGALMSVVEGEEHVKAATEPTAKQMPVG
ncbi:MAG: MATE family efflux transporter, partial [Sphingomonas sp.]